MADKTRRHQPMAAAKKRQPLIDVPNKINTPPVSQRHTKSAKHIKTHSSSHPSLPHNESLETNGTLALRSSEHPESPAHKRISQLSKDERNPKRDSAISTASTTSARKRKTFIGHWQLGRTIGRGGCSRVRVVRHRHRDQYGAVKIITRSVAESTRAQSLANLIESTRGTTAPTTAGYKPIPFGLEREIAVMKLLEHPNIVRLFDVWENRNELYLIMEYVEGGELFHFVDERKGLSEEETVYIFRQIVSALLYCHRLLICHRDLKPENILLNQDDLSVKLIDFGMAALQPEGRKLSTPCGSPHYAAPEVVSSKPYDGKQADVWSCGVILYVMLTGTTPYNYGEEGDIRLLFRDIARAKYYMPPALSLEAKDLIKKIFVPDPEKRITMDGVWDHPFLHKYDEQLGFVGVQGTKESAVGVMPKLDQWKVKRIQDIDREILSNMRTLWHSEPEQSLVDKLLNNDYNQEKLFYAALIKHREEHLENYYGEADDISYSASDYHHSRMPPVDDAPPMPERAQRTQSQYSIMNDEHLRQTHSFVGSPPSMSSYDPYRASRDPIVDARGEYVNVHVHRNGTTSTRRTTGGNRLRHPHTTRLEMLQQNNRRASAQSTASLTRSGKSRPSLPRSSNSRHSMTSSLLPSSPPVVASMRPSELHKRNVSFSHIRRISTTSAFTGQQSSKSSNPATPGTPGNLRQRQLKAQAVYKDDTDSSPLAHMDQPLKSRKERGAQLETRIKPRNSDTPHQYMRSEIRKHSAELEKACEEAFFRDSFGSGVTARTSVTDRPSPYDTPPSSVSAATPEIAQVAAKPPLPPRALPELPKKDTPNTYLTRTLEETRKKLEAYKGGGEEYSAKFDEVMKMLENIKPGAAAAEHMRIRTAPEIIKISDQAGWLPIICEESAERSSKDTANWHRSVTDPVHKGKKIQDRTVRMVPPSISGTVAPLNVRKRSNGSQTSTVDPARRPTVKPSKDTLRSKHNVDLSGLTSWGEDTTLLSPTVVRKKRSGWFGRSKKGSGAQSPAQDSTVGQASTVVPPGSAQSSEFPIRKSRLGKGKNGLSKWIGRMSREKGLATTVTETDITTMTHHSLDSLFSSLSPSPSSNDNPPPAGPERSWFARFFNIKPAVHILCFTLPRGKARQELVLLLKEWRQHGIRDLESPRGTNIISARVDKNNTLEIKPVTFRIELFVVLEHGRKVGLTIARFVQVKGAVSGFRKVIEVADGVMRARKWLVEDEEKWRALCEVVAD
ncbi:hypothetical protein DOTSEDRAFT_162654 [Dothistroma septosporum NZE10]|uniref:non-specific serine/threonine protein kinase n=1 Tax=Dothistroma septosporum (strain NZE10 / CBS 128990) TaxID=675120 RepID=N1Q2F3_DOTSN|nr:hypothetical protein DOTSEDRAFT_162654 [Dothistroma septosporum NZE10]